MDPTLKLTLDALTLREKAEVIKVLRRQIDDEWRDYLAMFSDYGKVFDICRKAAEEVFGIDNLVSKCRQPRYVVARAFVALSLRELGYSFVRIADLLGMTHSTVIYLCNQITYELRTGGGNYEFDINEMYNDYKTKALL